MKHNSKYGLQLSTKQTEASKNSGSAKTSIEVDLDSPDNIYAYDEVYDSMKEKKNTKDLDQPKQPRYINGLLKSASLRKLDRLKVKEKKILKQENEFSAQVGEKFVTQNYKKHKQELSKLEQLDEKDVLDSTSFTEFYKKIVKKDHNSNSYKSGSHNKQEHHESIKYRDHKLKHKNEELKKQQDLAALSKQNKDTEEIDLKKKKFEKRTDTEKANSAKERYLQRKRLNKN